MAINLSQAFNRTAPAPIDGSLVLSKADMLAVNDNLMPEKYFTICTDDGQIYTYDKNATPDAQTGKFSPYLGGNADAGFTPVGTVIAVMGVTAPANYLACNGQVVNIADYPELANYFNQQFGSKNKFGGDGATTFGIPDLRGEFLRGTGTNSHTNQGNGAAVGTHQNATEETTVRVWNASTTQGQIIAEVRSTTSGTWGAQVDNVDKWLPNTAPRIFVNMGTKNIEQITDQKDFGNHTSRPTNTSVLYCIATKNIYLNPSLDYSTDEKVVGTWIDGKTLYQRTFIGTLPTATDGTPTTSYISDSIITNLSNLVKIEGVATDETQYIANICNVSNASQWTSAVYNKQQGLALINAKASYSGRKVYVTIQYTKTTD